MIDKLSHTTGHIDGTAIGGFSKGTPTGIPVSTDRVDLGGKLSILEKSIAGWERIGDRIYENRIVQGHHMVRENISRAAKVPFDRVIRKVSKWADDGNDLKEIKKESSRNLQEFSKTAMSPPEKVFINKPESEENKGADDSFWDRHPAMRSFCLGYRALKKTPQMILQMPMALFRLVFPALYGGSGKGKMIGEDLLIKATARIQKYSLVKKSLAGYRNLMAVPGVSLAMSIAGPIFGVSRMLEGLFEFKEGVKFNDPRRMLDGKVDMMTGALATIKPLALLAIMTEGAHVFLKYRMRKKGMTPDLADRIMTNIFAAVTAPIGLAAYVLTARPK